MKTFIPTSLLLAFALASHAFEAGAISPYTGYCIYTTNVKEMINAKIGQVSGATAREAQEACADAVRKELGMTGEKGNVVPALNLPDLEIEAIRVHTDSGKIITLLSAEPVKKI